MEFVCRIGTPEGEVREEVHSARNERTLRRELEGKGLHVFSIRNRSLLAQLRLPSFGRSKQRIDPSTLLLFNQELAALLHSGLPMLQALEMMAERQREPFFKEILASVHDQVKSGSDLSDAFDSLGDLLPPLYAPTLKAGERSGELEQVIRRFVRYQSLLMSARKRVLSSLVYPLVLVGLSLILIGVMTFYVVPKFTEFFTALGSELPLLTRAIVGFSLFVRENWLATLGGLVAGIWLLGRWRRSEMGAAALSRVKLRLPLVGSIFHRMSISEFCRSLSTLLAGGIPVVMALENSVGAVGNLYIRSRLEPIVGRVREGTPLADALEDTEIAPEIAIDMVKVGETTGALDEMLNNASDFLDQEVETRLQRVLSLLEPIMLILMGAIVAILLVAIYLPLFSLLGDVQA